MVKPLSCPNCGAVLKIEHLEAVVQCVYCGTANDLDVSSAATPANDPQLPDLSLSEVAMLFRAGKRVQATIRYREITGAGLKEAKIAIDRFAAGEALRRPNLMDR